MTQVLLVTKSDGSLWLEGVTEAFLSFFKFFSVCLFLREREREGERQSEVGEGGRAEREGDTESEAGSRLRAVSTEPDVGLEPMNREIMA